MHAYFPSVTVFATSQVNFVGLNYGCWRPLRDVTEAEITAVLTPGGDCVHGLGTSNMAYHIFRK